MREIQLDNDAIDDQKHVGMIEIHPSRVSATEPDESHSVWQNLYLKARPYFKPTIEGVGLGGGAILGTPFGPLGTIGGGAIGYGVGTEAVDLLDEIFGVKKPETFKQGVQRGAENLAEGAVMTAGGEIIGAGLGMGAKGAKAIAKKILPPIRESAIERRAGELLTRVSKTASADIDAQIEKNIIEAHELEKVIPGVKFTRGQLTNDADAIVLERALTRTPTRIKGPGGVEIGGADLNQAQRAYAERALQNYYQSKVVGAGDVTALTNKVQGAQDVLTSKVKSAQQTIDTQIARLSRAMDEQQVGGAIRERMTLARAGEKAKAKALYDQIPANVQVGSAPLEEATIKVALDFNPNVERAITFPVKIMEGVGSILKTQKQVGKDTMSFDQLRKLRSTVLSEIRLAKAKQNDQLVRRLEMLRNGIEESVDSLADDASNAGELYRKASLFYKEYSGKFKQGTVADILASGPRGEEGRVALSNIAGRFFTKDGVDDFIRAVGNDKEAKTAMQDYARATLKNKAFNPYTGELNPSRAYSWITQNGKVLDKLGIRGELLDVAKSGKDLGVAQAALDTFNKSVASKVLNADIGEVAAKAFTGSKNYGATAKELLALVKGNKNAEAGLKKAVAEHILESSQVTAEGFFTDFKVSNAILTRQLKKFAPALRELYRNEPEKLKAIMDVHRAYQIMERTTRSPIGGGSDTAENLGNVLIGAAGARAGRFYLIKSIRDFFRKYSDSRINTYLLRATFDPDYTQSLIALTRQPINEKIQSHATNLILYGLTRSGTDNQGD